MKLFCLGLLGVLCSPVAAQFPTSVPLFQFEVDRISPDYIWGPSRALAVDFDGDGDRDLVTLVGSLFSGVLRVDLAANDGRGVFISRGGFSLTEEPFDLDVGDVDGDGLLDLYVSFPAGTDRLYRGAGFFPFGSPQTLNGIASDYIQLADVDGDGDLDAVSSGQFISTEVRWNDGQGNFTGGVTYPMEGISRGVDLFDADGDGDLDCLALVLGSGSFDVVLWRNDGTGTWVQDPTPLQSGFFGGAEVLDGDGDGDQDVLVWAGGPATFHANDGAGNFSSGIPAGPSGIVAVANELVSEDVDGDGNVDLVFATQDDVRFWRGRGDGTYFDATATAGLDLSPGVSASPRQVLVEELDGRPGLDVFTLELPRGRLWRNDGSGAFRAAFEVGVTSGSFPRAADVDRDGISDLIQISTQAVFPQRLLHLRGVGDGSFEDVSSSTLTAVRSWVSGFDLEDVDSDGDVDLVAAFRNPLAVALFLNDGAGNFALRRSQDISAFGVFDGVAVGDVDGDGQAFDLILTSTAVQNPMLAFRDDGVSWQPTTGSWLRFVPPDTTSEPDLQDVDGDGDLDLTLRRASSPVLWNDGVGVLTPDSSLFNAVQPFETAFGDLSGNGVMEVVVGSQSVVGVGLLPAAVYARVGGAWQRVVVLDGDGAPTCVDVDEDGDLDVLLQGPSSIHINVGAGTFAQQAPPGIAFGSAFEPGDFDGDGDVDFAVAAAGQPVSLFQNSTRRIHAPLPADRGYPFVVELSTRENGGTLALLGVSATAAKVTLPGVGVRQLGLGDLWFTAVPLAPQTNFEVRFDIPNVAALAGMTLRTQAAFLERAGPRLSGFRELTIR